HRLHHRDVALEAGDPGADAAPIGLDLRLTRTAQADAAVAPTAPAAAAALAGQGRAPAPQPGQEVLQLGQLDLGLALVAFRVLGEDVEDQRGTVDDLDVDLVFERTQLGRRELAVADHRVGPGRDHHRPQLGDLAAAD